MIDEERQRRGDAHAREVLLVEPGQRVGPFAEAVRDFVLAEVWSRSGLPRREKRLITLTCSAMQREEISIRAHIRAALKTGELTVAELREFALHFAVYGSFPLASFVNGIVTETALELGMESGTETS